MMARDTAKSSNSMTAYQDSASERNLEPAWMRGQLSPAFVATRNRVTLVCSAKMRVGLAGLKNELVGADVRACFAEMKALSRSGDHKNSFLVLSSGRKGASRFAVLAESWLAKLKKARRSVRFTGVGKSEIAMVIDLSTL